MHPKMKGVIGGYLKTGHPLTINEKTVLTYPLDTHRKLYEKYEAITTNLELRGMRWKTVVPLLGLFRRITSLKLKGLRFFQHDDKTRGQYGHGFNYYHLPKPEPLKVSQCLRNLTLDLDKQSARQYEWDYFHGLPVQFLTLRYSWTSSRYDNRVLQMVKSFKKLTHLRILEPVHPMHRDSIEALAMVQRLEFSYMHLATEEEGDSLIQVKLNNDCLRLILSFLPVEDYVALYDTCLRLRRLVLEEPHVKYTCSNDAAMMNYSRNNFYDTLGKICTSLSLDGRNNQGALFALRNCERLEELKLANVRMSAWFYRQNENLKKLILSTAGDGAETGFVDRLYLKELEHIEEFSTYEFIVNPANRQFLDQNKGQMTKLCIGSLKGKVNGFCKIVREMRGLRELQVQSDQVNKLLFKGASFPELQKLKICLGGDKPLGLEVILSQLTVPKLQSLVLHNYPAKWTEQLSAQLGGLQELQLVGKWEGGNLESDLISGILLLLSLKRLIVDKCVVLRESTILTLVQRLPLLQELETGSHVEGGALQERLRGYLKSTSRTFRLNSMRI